MQISHINYIVACLSFLQAYYHLKIQASLSNFVYHQWELIALGERDSTYIVASWNT